MNIKASENGMIPDNPQPQAGGLEDVDDILSWFSRPGARVLDLGCGAGIHAKWFVEKGFHVTGVDVSESAVRKARENTKGMGKAAFEVLDLQKGNLVNLGLFDLVLSLGNTVSFLDRNSLLPLFEKVRRVLAPGGVFAYSAYYWGNSFEKSFIERGADGEIIAIWERELKEDKGAIRLRGHFMKDGATKGMEVQCFKVPEMTNLLDLAGFSSIRWSNKLDFRGRALPGADSIYFRAVNAR